MKQIKVLVVEDEGIVQLDLVARLTDLGYTVAAAASSGEAAIREASGTRPDLVLMDIRIKGPMDGIETASILRARFGIPIVFVTALYDPATIERAQALKPAGILTKPFRDHELELAIDAALECSLPDGGGD
jgi:CheY-like chemotaxis protein